jgi:hypothetical protein
MEILRKMSALCQTSADETSPGAERERLQIAADKFRNEADTLSIRAARRDPH